MKVRNSPLSIADLDVDDTSRRSTKSSGVAHLSPAGGGDWSHVDSQIGMFAFTGLSAAQVDRLREVHNIYLTRDGRASIAGLTSPDVPYVAAAIKEVVEAA